MKRRRTTKVTIMMPCVAIAITWFFAGAFVMAQEDERFIEISKEFDPPVNIEYVSAANKQLKVNEPFQAGPEWLDGLRLKIRNDSPDRVNHVSINIRFPRHKTGGKLDYVDTINYGESPIPTESGELLTNTASPLTSGESVELELRPLDYARIKKNLSDKGYGESPERVKIYVATIGFVDGSIWMAGRYYTLDKANPGRLIPKKVDRRFR